MSTIKQISVYNGSNWDDYDIGVSATDLENALQLNSPLVGSTNIKNVLTNLIGSESILTGNRILITNGNGKLITSTINPQTLNTLDSLNDIPDKVTALEKTTNVVGIIQMFAGTVAPVGWKFCNGEALLISEYQELNAVLNGKYNKSGVASGYFNLPDFRSRFPAGYTPGGTGGSANAIIPSHAHSIPAKTTGSGGASHSHYLTGSTAQRLIGYNYGTVNKGVTRAAVSGSGNHIAPIINMNGINKTLDFTGFTSTGNTTASHTHSTPASTTGSQGVSATNANLPPYLGINFIIYTGVVL